MPERRAAARCALVLAAEVTVESSGAQANARTSDVGHGGCYIDTLNPISAGTLIQLRLSHDGEVFETRARVIYEAPGMGMGITFLDVPAPQHAILDRWLASAPPA
jgi:hypothetical protein